MLLRRVAHSFAETALSRYTNGMGKGKNNDCVAISSFVTAEVEAPQELDLPKTWNSEKLNISYVDSVDALAECIKVLRDPQVIRLGLDIETTGGLSPCHGTTRLIQIGVELPEPRQFLIDCWAIDPAPLLPLLEDPRLEIVTCNGKYEQTHLNYRYGVVLTNLYDVCYASRAITAQKNEPNREIQSQAVRQAEAPYRSQLKRLRDQLGQAKAGQETEDLTAEIERAEKSLRRARGRARRSTSSPRKIGNDFRRLMRRYVGRKISKTQQTSAWDSIKLTENQRRYAAMDVAGLLDIRRAIGQDVAERGLQEEVSQANQQVLDRCLAAMSSVDLAATKYTRMARAMTHAADLQQLDSLYSGRGQMTLHHSFRHRLDDLYRRRSSELASQSELGG